MAYLVDSNVIINYVAENFDATILSKLDIVFDSAFNHSVIAVMEVMGYHGDSSDMNKFERLFNAGNRLNIDDAVVKETINIRKTVKIKLPDAIIAATAIVHTHELLTENTNDFLNVPGLKVSNPRNI
jgi:predicted nucleic acid-binding protein